MRPDLRWILLLGCVCGAPAPAGAFTVLRPLCARGLACAPEYELDLEATLRSAARWSAAPRAGSATGLHDGIQVALPDGFAEAFAPTPDRVPEMQGAVAAAFATWETPELRFDLRSGVTGARGGAGGLELDLFLGGSRDPEFRGGTFVGFTSTQWQLQADRLLTNGQVLAGNAFLWADIVIAVDRFGGFFELLLASDIAQESDRAVRLQNLLMHEIGHALGLDHPNETPWANLDTDFDPMTRIAVDPLDPFAGLHISTVFDPNTIMRGTSPPDPHALLYGELQADDLSGRDVLYPGSVPEPGTALLLGAGLWALARYAPRTIRR